MNWFVYYIALIILNILSLLFFRNSIHMSYLSLIPLCLLGNSMFQAYYYAHHKAQEPNTAYSTESNLTDREWRQISRYSVSSHLIAIPLYFPFVFFFSWGKLLSFVLFVTALLGGSIWFRVRHSKELQERYDQEKNELWEQERKEEMGQWK